MVRWNSRSSPKVRVNSPTASMRPSWSSAVGRRSRTTRFTSTTSASTSSATRSSSSTRRCRALTRAASVRAGAPRCASPSDTPVNAGPSPSWRSRRKRRRSSSRADTMETLDRRSSAARRTHPTARPSGPASSASTRSSRARSDGPCSQPTTSRPTTSSRCCSSTTRSYVVAGPLAASRRQPSGVRTSIATASRRSSRCRLADERRQQFVAGIGADMVDDAAHDFQRVVAGTPHQPVDGVPDTSPGRFGEDGDDAGRRHEQPGRAIAADEPAETGDDAGVHDDDGARERQPADDVVSDAVEASRSVAERPARARRRSARGRVARSSSGPTTSPPGKLHPQMPNRSGTTASQAATAPTASQPGSGSSSCRAPARHSTTSRTVAAVADAATSHVATSTTSNPGDRAPAASPMAMTAIERCGRPPHRPRTAAAVR